MKRAVLIILAFLPLTLAAQEKDTSPVQNQAEVAPSLQASASSISDHESFTQSAAGDGIESGEENPQQQPNSKPSQATKPSSKSYPIFPGSVVGYVDSAIIGSQIRIRFDDAFHDSAPDRAEFFYAQCSCTNLAPQAPGPDFPGASTNVNFQQIYLQAEYALVSRFSIFTEVPFRWIEPQPNSFIVGSGSTPLSTATNSGISDVRAGIKLALATSSGHTLTLQVRSYFPSGNGSLGLGTAHYSIEPSLLYYQRLSERWSVESQLGDWHPIGGSKGELNGTTTLTDFAGDVLLYGIGPSYQLINGEHFKLAPVVELYGWHVFSGLETQLNSFLSTSICFQNNTTGPGCATAASGTNIVNVKAGLRTSFGNRSSVYLGFGQAVTHAVWYEHIIRLEYRYSF